MRSESPLVNRLVPFVALVVGVVFVYTLGSFFESYVSTITEKTIPGNIEKIIAEAKRSVRKLKNAAKAGKHKPGKTRASRSTAPAANIPLSGSPDVILDFESASQQAILQTKKSPGVIALFTIDTHSVSDYSPVSAHLIVSMPEKRTKERLFASGVINLPKPVVVKGREAIEIMVKGKGIGAFGFAVLGKKDEKYLRWDLPSNNISGKWRKIAIPFKSLNLWSYNPQTKKYKRIRKRAKPATIFQVRVYIQQAHLRDRLAGELWIDTVALR